uniref:DNA-directed RNA polymerase III subunit RPC4 n=1 Tax=Parastrongyloides trichosuri TaxID=131310 RepID=A0A0N4ZV24_PARTI
MSQRGTGNKSRARPNLALSGVLSGTRAKKSDQEKEDKGKEDKDKKEKKIREGRKNDRGRSGSRSSRGGRGGSKIIQTEGIFSSGVGEEAVISRRIKKEANLTGTEEVLETRAVNVEMGARIGASDEYDKSLPSNYEEEWQSDIDDDNAALEELQYSQFIDDIERMKNPPLVLPPNETVALKDLLDIDEEEEEKLNKVQIPDVKIPLYALNDNDVFNSIKASGYFRKMIKEGDESLFSIQLPATLRVIGDYANVNQNKKLNEDDHCLELFGNNVEIGKLKFLKNGKVCMEIGGNRLDIGAGISSGYSENLVMIENPNKKLQVTDDGVKMEIDDSVESQQKKKVENEEDILHVISPVKSHLIAYHDLITLCERDESSVNDTFSSMEVDGTPEKVKSLFRSRLIDKMSKVINDELRISEEKNINNC